MTSLLTTWRERARECERFGYQAPAADLWRQAAAELEAEEARRMDQLLSPKEAAREVAWAEGTIRKKLASGELLNEGGPRKPKVRRRVLLDAVHGERKLAVVR